MLYLIFEINIYKWADFIQIVCTGQNLVAMLKYKYLFFFFTGYPVLRTTENQCFAAWPFGGQSTLQGQKFL